MNMLYLTHNIHMQIRYVCRDLTIYNNFAIFGLTYLFALILAVCDK